MESQCLARRELEREELPLAVVMSWDEDIRKSMRVRARESSRALLSGALLRVALTDPGKGGVGGGGEGPCWAAPDAAVSTTAVGAGPDRDRVVYERP